MELCENDVCIGIVWCIPGVWARFKCNLYLKIIKKSSFKFRDPINLLEMSLKEEKQLGINFNKGEVEKITRN